MSKKEIPNSSAQKLYLFITSRDEMPIEAEASFEEYVATLTKIKDEYINLERIDAVTKYFIRTGHDLNDKVKAPLKALISQVNSDSDSDDFHINILEIAAILINNGAGLHPLTIEEKCLLIIGFLDTIPEFIKTLVDKGILQPNLMIPIEPNEISLIDYCKENDRLEIAKFLEEAYYQKDFIAKKNLKFCCKN